MRELGRAGARGPGGTSAAPAAGNPVRRPRCGGRPGRGSGHSVLGTGRAIAAAAAAPCGLGRSGPRCRSRSGPARNPHPPLRLPPPRFSRSPGPFVVLCGSAYRRALCSWRWRTGGPPVPPTPLLPWGRREGGGGAGAAGSAAPPRGRAGAASPSRIPRCGASALCPLPLPAPFPISSPGGLVEFLPPGKVKVLVDCTKSPGVVAGLCCCSPFSRPVRGA